MSGVPATGEGGAAYRLIRVVGSGGMGVVHEAWDLRLDRRVALKMLHPHLVTDPKMSEHFLREARLAARLEHPNVVRIYRIDTFQGQWAIEMQYVDGLSLQTLLRSGPFSAVQAADVLRQVLEALAACHAAGIVHCDLKPANLLVTATGQVLLSDFGIAKALLTGDASNMSTTITGPLWGTPKYSPPEAFHGDPITPRWDIYAAGLMIYEALAGESPFHATTPSAIMHEVLYLSPPPLTSVCPQVSGAFASLIHDLMARDPEARPQDAIAALGRLHETAECGSLAQDTQPLQPLVAHRKANTPPGPGIHHARRRKFAALAAIAAVVVAVAWIAIVQRRATPAESPPARPTPKTTPTTAALPGLNPEHVMPLLYEAYFAGASTRDGRELWRLARGEIELVADIAPGPASSNPRNFARRSDTEFVFAATTPETGEELWFCSSGDDVRMIKDIILGPMGSEPEPVAAYESLVLFYATTLADGRELWCTNTREGQTAMVEDLNPGINGSPPMSPRVYADGPIVYLAALCDGDRGVVLFYYDFRTNSIHEIGDVAEDTGAFAAFAVLDSKLLFANDDGAHGYELWVYDPAQQTMNMLVDLWPGTESGWPAQFFVWNDRMLFKANDGREGVELWITDGTAEGTTRLADINPGPGDSDPFGYVVVGDRLVFRAMDAAAGHELWTTDGTPTGTMRVTDIMPGPESSVPYNVSARGDAVFFSAKSATHGEELWTAQFGPNGWDVRLVADIAPGPTSSEPYGLQWFGNTGLFAANVPNLGRTLCSFEPDAQPIQIKAYDATKKTRSGAP